MNGHFWPIAEVEISREQTSERPLTEGLAIQNSNSGTREVGVSKSAYFAADRDYCFPLSSGLIAIRR